MKPSPGSGLRGCRPIDDNGNGLVDCADPNCTTLLACNEICDDGVDNDLNGLTDCRDPHCDRSAWCWERCDDHIDNDGDGDVDCEDTWCTDHEISDIVCAAFNIVDHEECFNGVDEGAPGANPPHDFLLDCEDPDCDGQCPEACGDGRDNDADGLVDCEDADCASSPPCVEDCSNQVDDDGDGRIDCWDDDCFGPDCFGATRARILDAQLHASRVVDLIDTYIGNEDWAMVLRLDQTLTAESVVGSVEVSDGYGGLAERCAFGVERAVATNNTLYGWDQPFSP